MKKVSNFQCGFTLVELLIVIAVIGVLAGGIMLVLDPAAQFQKANDARRKADISQIEKALETFYQDVGKYPEVESNKIKGLDGNAVDWGTSFMPYISALPADPNSSKKYVYHMGSGGQTYYLYASLDRGANDPQACNQGDACASLNSNGISDDACGGTCNYGVSSPNVSP